jgi:nitrate reductase gamma subunit
VAPVFFLAVFLLSVLYLINSSPFYWTQFKCLLWTPPLLVIRSVVSPGGKGTTRAQGLNTVDALLLIFIVLFFETGFLCVALPVLELTL